MTRRTHVWIVLAVLLVAGAYALGTQRGEPTPATISAPSGDAGVSSPTSKEPTIWTCSMHPQIRLSHPGKCPICFMDLIPVESSSAAADAAQLTMSEAAMKLAEVETTPVRRMYPQMELRLVGKIEYDETRLRKISAWVGGRLDRLYVDYTGVVIRKGDHLVEMYSPDLVSAQEELLQAVALAKQLREGNGRLLQSTAGQTIEAAREKLRLLGLTEAQIQQIEARGSVDDHVTIYAPIDGVVIAKHAVEGAYVQTGSPIYEIADLSHVWVKMDAYESDLQWLRYGQEVTFTAEAYPGRTWTGRIAFIDPMLDPRTRTAKVRVNIENEARQLKPAMFVRATVLPEISSTGQVMVADLAGKWMCPMHPEVISDGPGACRICGMALVPTEKLGYSVATADEQPPLVIPASAPLITGRRAVVYVRLPDTERPTFEGREVVLGPRAGDWYVVESGLAEGERVVVHGAFKIDSAMQIQAKPSMMDPADQGRRGTPQPMAAPAAFRQQLGHVTDAYLEVTAALAGDDFPAAHHAASALQQQVGQVDMELLTGEAHGQWMQVLGDLRPAAAKAAQGQDIEALRAALPDLTASVAKAVTLFGVGEDANLLLFHCPMAVGGAGADWIQSSTTVANPYYGAAMLRCGDLRQRLAGEGK